MIRPWWGPAPDEDQEAVLDLVDDLVGNRPGRLDDERLTEVDAARRALAEHGLWTVGTDESQGGGGAELGTALMVIARLAGTWPAMAWASVQAHAAAFVLSDVLGTGSLRESIHAAAPIGVCPVDPAEGDDVELAGSRLRAAITRVDAAGDRPRLVMLMPDAAVVVPPEGVTFGPIVRRTGLDGALTVSCSIDVALPDDAVVRGPQVPRARTFLALGATAVAAGIAEASAQAAVSYSRSRVQFGAPLTELPTVRGSLVGQVAQARALLTQAIRAGTEGPEQAAAMVGPAMDGAIDVAAAAVQSHGGYGYMAEYDVEGLLRDAISLRAATRAAETGRTAARHLVGADA